MEDMAGDPSTWGHGPGDPFEAQEVDSKSREKRIQPTAANLPMCSGRTRSLCSTKEV